MYRNIHCWDVPCYLYLSQAIMLPCPQKYHMLRLGGIDWISEEWFKLDFIKLSIGFSPFCEWANTVLTCLSTENLLGIIDYQGDSMERTQKVAKHLCVCLCVCVEYVVPFCHQRNFRISSSIISKFLSYRSQQCLVFEHYFFLNENITSNHTEKSVFISA